MSVVIITGCSSGFGLFTSLAFARRGHRVFATMRSLERSAQLRAAARDEGVEVEVIELDVTDDSSVRSAIAQILSKAGEIDVLVNNAGTGARAAVETFPDRSVRDVFETNVFGVLRMLRAVLPGMRERHQGVVVNVSSVAGLIPIPFNAAYSASKHALEAFTEALAFEVEPFGIRVALVEPGYFRTNIGENVLAHSSLDPQSPYGEPERLALLGVRPAVEGGGDPRVVAETIVEAAFTDHPRLRWPVGADAAGLLEARGRLSEGDWIAWLRANFLSTRPGAG